jgi:hypothetical protein
MTLAIWPPEIDVGGGLHVAPERARDAKTPRLERAVEGRMAATSHASRLATDQRVATWLDNGNDNDNDGTKSIFFISSTPTIAGQRIPVAHGCHCCSDTVAACYPSSTDYPLRVAPIAYFGETL